MEPQVFAAGGVKGEPVVLGVVPPHQDLKAVAGGKPQEIRRFLALVPLLVILQVALALQLRADLIQRRLAGGRFHLI